MVEKDFETGQYFLSEEAMRSYFKECLSGESGINWDVFILINRKGYWDYKIFFNEGFEKKEGQIIISDRYLDKCPREQLLELLSGKIVIVYDDSLTHGGNLFSYYLLCKRAGAKKVIPVVYALNVDFPTDRTYILMKQEMDKAKKDVRFQVDFNENEREEFVSKIYYKLLLGTRDIDRMSIKQTMLFQKYESPLVMDLPILNHIAGENDCRITLEKEAFERLCRPKDGYWEFIENKMFGWGEPIVASYFQYKDKRIEKSLGNLFHDFVVKCKYNERDGKVQVVFTPFAIVKSSHLRKVFQNFVLFYKDTAYGEKLLKNFPGGKYDISVMERDSNLCKALFRAVIFRLSDYVGRKFQKYVRDVLQLELEYDWKIMEDNFDAEFINTERELYERYDEKTFEKLIFEYYDNEKVLPVNQKEVFELWDSKIEATQERINVFIRERICEIKRKCINGSSLLERMYTLETMEEEIKERYIFENEEERKMLTTAILLFLETSSFSNCLYVAEGIIYRGFRYGENSDIFLHEDLWYFFTYLYAYYVENRGESLKENYNNFMEWLGACLKENSAIGCWISSEGFKFLKEYFGKMEEEELEEEIVRRVYLLNYNEFGKEDMNRAEQMRKAANMVKKFGKA